jgi:hypothetical protein
MDWTPRYPVSMSFNPVTNTLVDPVRPAFITAGRNNMVHMVMMLHHRIPWNLLRTTMNNALSGAVDEKIINALLTLSPEASKPLTDKFKVAANRIQANRALSPQQILDLQAVEQEIFSLPCNLFLGCNNRADDPGTSLDFTPDDVNYAGVYAAGAAGELQLLRETLYGQLSADNVSVPLVKKTCTSLAAKWIANGGGLDTATAHNALWWDPGAVGVAFTFPPFRHWVHPNTGNLTLGQAQALIVTVTTRAKRLGRS